MSCFIDCKGQTILKLANLSMASFYEKLIDMIIKRKESSNQTVLKFAEKLDQDLHGLGVVCADICESFKDNSNDLNRFIKILEEAIKEFCDERNYSMSEREKFTQFLDAVKRYYLEISHSALIH